MNYLDRRGVIFFLIIDALLVALAVSAPFLRRERPAGSAAAEVERSPGIQALYGE